MRGEINLGWWQEEGDIGQVARGGVGVKSVWAGVRT